MLTRLVVKNFKSIGPEGIDIELKPLTIFVGPNGGGKSSLIDGVVFLAQRGSADRLWQGPDKWSQLIHKKGAPTKNGEEIKGAVRVCLTRNGASEFGCEFTVSSARPDWELENNDIEWVRGNTWVLRATRGAIPYETQTGQRYTWVGAQGEHLLYALNTITPNKEPVAFENIRRWATEFGLVTIAAGLVREHTIAADYRDDKLQAGLNLALASSGTRQILPVIVQIFWSEPGSIIMIEEPEISLHPKSQVKLVKMFAEAIAEDKQLLITTHSSFLLLALSQPIKDGKLSADQVAVYDVTKTSQGTQAKRLPLTKEGYIKGWVPSFAKVESKLLKERVKSLPEA